MRINVEQPAMESLAGVVRFDAGDLARRLQESLDTLAWGLAMVPARWHHQSLPFGRDASSAPPWSVALNLAHMAVYEDLYAAPVLRDLAAGRDGVQVVPSGDEDWFERDSEALSREPLDRIMARLVAARQAQIETVRSFDDDRLNAAITPLWGRPLQSAGWAAAQTVQHTWEHGTPILQAALFL